MGRLKPELLERAESLCDRVLDVSDALAIDGRSRRVLDQIVGCGSSIGANLFEADESMSRADFVRCLSIVNKELNEVRFWLRLVARRGWIAAGRLDGLLAECEELKRIIGSMIARTKKRS